MTKCMMSDQQQQQCHVGQYNVERNKLQSTGSKNCRSRKQGNICEHYAPCSAMMKMQSRTFFLRDASPVIIRARFFIRICEQRGIMLIVPNFARQQETAEDKKVVI
jgi:hypothetical protein